MAKHSSLLILFSLILLSSISSARDSRFFDKVTTNAAVQQPQDPDFLPQNERGYGLYAEPHHPTNYNPVTEAANPQIVQNHNNDPIRNNAGGFGMSDTRYMDGGKYFYDLQSDLYSRNHPYNSRNNYYGNGNTGYEFNGGTNSDGGYKDGFEFQDNNLP